MTHNTVLLWAYITEEPCGGARRTPAGFNKNPEGAVIDGPLTAMSRDHARVAICVRKHARGVVRAVGVENCWSRLKRAY